MKNKLDITRAFCVVALVFGFASCGYDNELQPPQRLLDQKIIQPADQAGKAPVAEPNQ